MSHRFPFLLAVGIFVCALSVKSPGMEKNQDSTSHIVQKRSAFKTVFLEYYDSQDADRKISIIKLNLEKAYYLLKPLSLGWGAHALLSSGYRIDRRDPERNKMNANTVGLGLAGTIHLDLLRIESSRFFIDFRLGFLVCTDELPPGGTLWNFSQRYGVGVSVKLVKDMYLLLGGRHLHISNGGYPRNPGYNGNGPFAGFEFGF